LSKPRNDLGYAPTPVTRVTFHRLARRVFLPLAVDPIRQLHQEAVVGSEIGQIVHVATEAARAAGAWHLCGRVAAALYL